MKKTSSASKPRDSVGAEQTLKYKKLNKDQQWREATRIALAASMIGIATVMYFLIPKDLGTQVLAGALKAGLGFMGFFSFLYLIGTASHLKYKEAGYIQWVFITDGMRRSFFDLSVEMFAASFMTAFFISLDYVVKKLLPQTDGNSFWIALVVGILVAGAVTVINQKMRVKEKDGLNRY